MGLRYRRERSPLDSHVGAFPPLKLRVFFMMISTLFHDDPSRIFPGTDLRFIFCLCLRSSCSTVLGVLPPGRSSTPLGPVALFRNVPVPILDHPLEVVGPRPGISTLFFTLFFMECPLRTWTPTYRRPTSIFSK